MKIGEIWCQKGRPEIEVVITNIVYCKIRRWTWIDRSGKEHLEERLLNDYLIYFNTVAQGKDIHTDIDMPRKEFLFLFEKAIQISS